MPLPGAADPPSQLPAVNPKGLRNNARMKWSSASIKLGVCRGPWAHALHVHAVAPICRLLYLLSSSGMSSPLGVLIDFVLSRSKCLCTVVTVVSSCAKIVHIDSISYVVSQSNILNLPCFQKSVNKAAQRYVASIIKMPA